MPRYTRGDDGDIFRVVVTNNWHANEDREASSTTQCYGPYATLQAARTQCTRHHREQGWYHWRTYDIETKIQRTKVQWEDVV